MRIGYDAKTIRSMYASLGKEVMGYFNMDVAKLPPLSVRYVRELDFFGFETDLPATALATTHFKRDRYGRAINDEAREMVFNRHFTPYLYEDEMINVIIHEICHVVAGLDAQHGSKWADCVEQVGGFSEALFVPRKMRDVPALKRLCKIHNATMPTNAPSLGYIN